MISFSNEFESFLCYWIFGITVGVMPQGKLPKALLNISRGSILAETKNFVVFATSLHNAIVCKISG
jgi:hypothetical protein